MVKFDDESPIKLPHLLLPLTYILFKVKSEKAEVPQRVTNDIHVFDYKFSKEYIEYTKNHPEIKELEGLKPYSEKQDQ